MAETAHLIESALHKQIAQSYLLHVHYLQTSSIEAEGIAIALYRHLKQHLDTVTFWYHQKKMD